MRNITPKRYGPIYAKIIEEHFYKDTVKKKAFSRPENLDIVLCWNKTIKPYTAQCLEHLGITDYVVLGQRIIDWKNVYKLNLVLDYLKTRCKTEYVLHLDATDVLLVDDPQILLDRFLQYYNCGVLFNAEVHCHPNDDFSHEAKLFEEKTYSQKHRHLNSGCYIGRKDAIIKVLQEAIAILPRSYGGNSKINQDDQRIVRIVHKNLYPLIQIDSHRHLFQTLGRASLRDITSSYLQKGNPSHRYWSVIIRYYSIHLLLKVILKVIYSPVKKFFRSL